MSAVHGACMPINSLTHKRLVFYTIKNRWVPPSWLLYDYFWRYPLIVPLSFPCQQRASVIKTILTYSVVSVSLSQVQQNCKHRQTHGWPGGREDTEHSLLWVVDGDLGCRKAADSLSGSMAVECGLLLILRGEIFPTYISAACRL